MITTPAPTAAIFHDLLFLKPCSAKLGVATPESPLAGITAPDDLAAAALPELPDAGATACAAGPDPESCAATTDPELAATARPVSVSRFKRCKSARTSAAC